METTASGMDGSPGARAALRVAASLGEELGARLVAVHVLDRLADVGPTAERVAANVLYDEAPDAQAEARGEVGDVGRGRARRGRS
jgi:nucleotide-binding universal stress UspA family protein